MTVEVVVGEGTTLLLLLFAASRPLGVEEGPPPPRDDVVALMGGNILGEAMMWSDVAVEPLDGVIGGGGVDLPCWSSIDGSAVVEAGNSSLASTAVCGGSSLSASSNLRLDTSSDSGASFPLTVVDGDDDTSPSLIRRVAVDACGEGETSSTGSSWAVVGSSLREALLRPLRDLPTADRTTRSSSTSSVASGWGIVVVSGDTPAVGVVVVVVDSDDDSDDDL